MKIVGLTGTFGSGKTFVASIFKSLGARVIDADKVAHSMIKKGRPEYKKIVARFGWGLLDPKKEIDRRVLAEEVFADARKLKALNSIVHPGVIKYIKDGIKKAGDGQIIVIDAPLLVETNLHKMVDYLVVVKASKDIQVDRAVKKFKMKKGDVLKRIENQMPIEKKIKIADFVINNNGSRSETVKQARNVWRKIWK